MPPPDSLTVAAVSQDGKKIQLVGQGDTAFDVVDKDKVLPPLSAGLQFDGWVNPQGDYGPYVSVAKKQKNGSQSAPAGAQQGFAPPATPPTAPAPAPQPAPVDVDPQRTSIERQVAAKIAGELIGHEGYTALSNEDFAREFVRVTSAVHDAITDKLPF